VPTPEAFRSTVSAPEVFLLPLVPDRDYQWRPGWVSYSDGFDNNPDIEAFCGGKNEKAASAAACWRQGNLLHFGFEQDPAEMNENGRRLLLNAIAYISRFTEDRPIAITPSVFMAPVALPRGYLDRRIRGTADRNEMEWMVTPELFKKLSGMALPELRSWYDEHRHYLHPTSSPEPRLEVDEEARAIHASLDEPVFFERCIAALERNDSRAEKLLARYAPSETRNLKSGSEWSKWFGENKAYLFFSDQGDYRWYVDPLAKKRSVPSGTLRGVARASLP
jgi:hypothetical protein